MELGPTHWSPTERTLEHKRRVGVLLAPLDLVDGVLDNLVVLLVVLALGWWALPPGHPESPQCTGVEQLSWNTAKGQGPPYPIEAFAKLKVLGVLNGQLEVPLRTEVSCLRGGGNLSNPNRVATRLPTDRSNTKPASAGADMTSTQTDYLAGFKGQLPTTSWHSIQRPMI